MNVEISKSMRSYNQPVVLIPSCVSELPIILFLNAYNLELPYKILILEVGWHTASVYFKASIDNLSVWLRS